MKASDIVSSDQKLASKNWVRLHIISSMSSWSAMRHKASAIWADNKPSGDSKVFKVFLASTEISANGCIVGSFKEGQFIVRAVSENIDNPKVKTLTIDAVKRTITKTFHETDKPKPKCDPQVVQDDEILSFETSEKP